MVVVQLLLLAQLHQLLKVHAVVVRINPIHFILHRSTCLLHVVFMHCLLTLFQPCIFLFGCTGGRGRGGRGGGRGAPRGRGGTINLITTVFILSAADFVPLLCLFY